MLGDFANRPDGHGSKITNPSLQLRRSSHRLKSMAKEGNLLKQVGDRLFDSFLVRFNALRLLAVDFNLQQIVKIISLKMNLAPGRFTKSSNNVCPIVFLNTN